MKKILVIAALLAATSAFAEGQRPRTNNVAAQQQQQSSTSDATNAGNSQSTTYAPVTNVAAPDVKTQGADAAAISAAAAIEIARINKGDGSRDIAADREAALNRATAVEIAHINSSQTIKNTPSMGGPALTSSNDTCMGSASGALSAPGFGISLGKTYNDTNCVMLKNSRELWNMGMKAAALALMCNDSANKDALELTGFVCPQTEKANKQVAAQVQPRPVASVPAAKTVASSGYTGNDPIIKARLGLK
jgi:hypothetical protein